VGFEALTVTTTKIAVVYDVTPYNLVNCTEAPEYPAVSIIVYPDDEGNRIPCNVGILLPDYTA
jgi:hypothetical protein